MLDIEKIKAILESDPDVTQYHHYNNTVYNWGYDVVLSTSGIYSYDLDDKVFDRYFAHKKLNPSDIQYDFNQLRQFKKVLNSLPDVTKEKTGYAKKWSYKGKVIYSYTINGVAMFDTGLWHRLCRERDINPIDGEL